MEIFVTVFLVLGSIASICTFYKDQKRAEEKKQAQEERFNLETIEKH